MGKVIAIAIQKGGNGKTTTTQNLGVGLVLKGYKVLLIDLDGQCSLSYSCNADLGTEGIFEVLQNEVQAKEVIQRVNGIDIIPASTYLAGADQQFQSEGKEYLLKKALEPLKKRYDYILIDCPPSLNILTINALTFANEVIIPCQADIYSLMGIGQLANTINAVKEHSNSKLKITGILLTRYNNRAVLNKKITQMIEDATSRLGTKVFSSTIREGIAIKEAQAMQQDIFVYSKRSKVASDYMGLVEEVIQG